MNALIDKKDRSLNNDFNDDVDFSKFIGAILDNIWVVVFCTVLSVCIGVIYVLLATPIYKADALLQVESKSSGMSALVGDVGDVFSSESSSNTEIEIIKSRMNLGKTVEAFNLEIIVEPIIMPFIGRGLDRILSKEKLIEVTLLEFRGGVNSVKLVVNSDEGDFSLYNTVTEKFIVAGKSGETVSNNDVDVFVQNIEAKVNDEFILRKRSQFEAIQWLQRSLDVTERGKQTGVLSLSFVGTDRDEIEKILDDIAENYFLQNVSRSSAEAEKSLAFLQSHLPKISNQLVVSENSLNTFRQENESVNLNLEAQSILKIMVTLESQLNELTFEESEIAKKFTKDHPRFKSLLEKRDVLLKRKNEVNEQIKKLPKTQRDVLRMKRNVEVNQQIYIQLLNKVQELRIIKAGTVGNVRILDTAKAYTSAIKPKKTLTVVMITILGLIFSIGFIIIRSVFHKGIDSPDEIEAIGLPVYASIPLSDYQSKMNAKLKVRKSKTNFEVKRNLNETILSIANPADLSVEAFRGLRTSMHFSMMEAKNNIVMISGPSPGIGKSFVSANFSVVMANTGLKVLLIDADMRKGYLHKMFGLAWEDGLSDVLADKISPIEAINKSGIENLDIITRGQIPPNPSELLMHPRFESLVEYITNEYDLVLIDTPPVLAVTDPSIVGSIAGTTLMVGRFDKTTVKEISVASQRFATAGVDVKGVILNAIEKKSSSTYGYYNYSYKSDS